MDPPIDGQHFFAQTLKMVISLFIVVITPDDIFDRPRPGFLRCCLPTHLPLCPLKKTVDDHEKNDTENRLKK